MNRSHAILPLLAFTATDDDSPNPPSPRVALLMKGDYTIAEDRAGRGVFVRGLTEVEVCTNLADVGTYYRRRYQTYIRSRVPHGDNNSSHLVRGALRSLDVQLTAVGSSLGANPVLMHVLRAQAWLDSSASELNVLLRSLGGAG